MNRWIGLTLAVAALALSATVGFACDQRAQAVAVEDVKAVAANGEMKGCDMPCCAHAKLAAGDKAAAEPAGEKPCAAHDAKGCPKKTGATAAAKTDPPKDTAKAEPSADPGTTH